MQSKKIVAHTKKYFIHLIRHRRIEFLYGIIIIVLTGCAIYSAYSVLNDYLYDNMLTSIKMNTTDNILPFVQYFSVFYYFHALPGYSGRSIIPSTWSLSNDEILSRNLFPVGPNASIALARIAEKKNKAAFYQNNSTHLSLESQCDISTIDSLIHELDRNLWMSGESISQINFVADNDDFNAGKPMSVNFSDVEQLIRTRFPGFNQSIRPEINSKLISVVDNFLENSYGEELIEKMLSTLTPFKYLQLDKNEYADLPVTYFNDEFANDQVTVSVLLDFFADQSKRVRKWPIVFGFMPTDYHADHTNHSEGTEEVNLLFSTMRTPGSVFWTDNPASSRQYVQFDVTLKNFGIYNTSEVRKQEQCDICGNLTSVDDCMFKCKLLTVVDVCQCVPFIWRRLYYNDPKRRNLPRCTFQRYADCSLSDRFNATPCNADEYKPCVVTRNNYLVDVSYPIQPKTNNTPKIVFRFTFEEKTYIIYHDEYQNSLMQTFGTVGGNLGVFISFSLLGVWQFGVFVYMSCKRNIEQRRVKSMKHVHRTHGIISSWLHVAKLTADTHAQMQHRLPTQNLVRKDDLDETKREIDELRDEMEKQRRDAKQEIERVHQNAKTERNELKLLISSLEKRLQAQEGERKIARNVYSINF